MKEKELDISRLGIVLERIENDIKEIEMAVNAILNYLDLDLKKTPMFVLRKKT